MHLAAYQLFLANLSIVVWEYPSDEQQGADFIALLGAVREYLPEDRYLLTAVLPASKHVLQLINLPYAAAYLNFINLTAYDFFGSWTSRTGHHSQLYNMSKDEPSGSAGVGYLMAAGVPGKQILLGIPLYGRSFLHATATGQKYKGVALPDGTFQYKDLPRKGTKEQVDKRAVAAQCVGGDGGFVTYDNPETVKAKAAFCKQKGLGVRPIFLIVFFQLEKGDCEYMELTYLPLQGLFYFCAPMDAKDSKRSLITTGFRTLHSS